MDKVLNKLIKDKCYTLKIERILTSSGLLQVQQQMYSRMSFLNHSEELEKDLGRLSFLVEEIEKIQQKVEKDPNSKKKMHKVVTPLIVEQVKLDNKISSFYSADSEIAYINRKIKELILEEDFHVPLFNEVYGEWSHDDDANKLYELFDTFRVEYELKKKN
jgi:hypothetical protein